MPPFSLTDPEIFVGAYDLTCDLNKIDGSYNPNFLDATTFCSGGWRARVMGLNDVDFTAEGFNDFSAGGIDANTYPILGSINVVTVSLTNNGAVGEPAFLFRGLSVGDHSGATVGELATTALPFKGHTQMVSGKMAAARASRSATGSSSAVQLGTASSGQVFATRHVFSSAGNLAVFIESATAQSMAGAVTRVAFTTVSAAGGEWVSATISVTSGSWWRASWVTSSANDFAVGFSIR